MLYQQHFQNIAMSVSSCRPERMCIGLQDTEKTTLITERSLRPDERCCDGRQVFSGLWRLGAVSAARILGVQPDIACYAKLLTGAFCKLKVASTDGCDVFITFQLQQKTYNAMKKQNPRHILISLTYRTGYIREFDCWPSRS